ncbi:MAG: SurA N-terminal domain-containing protein [Algoriphagus sp.]|jgi:peptidyl-prolyl cis-trans isomerase D|uniref:SurA N-terminal domain-containing protein n=1 Tax=Algoriphagus sp. TaxID=1872435 RepID=UPI0027554667|nr:SurA N-terminal domain-containing protein [Algoriphagus sp.]MDP4839075.1 SurA N-terminal domain-containing protein [Algoriphagus sp.]MDP4904049.1 SurA N-terminal domain-containing protein [Algoriphagus sp.]MDP4958049.1 SurA N-terminal domain-containing protein [Algoriphagus sp.]
MALIKQIRQRTGLAIGVIAGGLILFLLGGDLLSPNSTLLNSNQNIVGEIAGEEITLEEFSLKVEEYKAAFQQRTGRIPAEAELVSVREQAWQALIVERVFQEEYDKLGLTISSQELIDMVQGKNIVPELRAQLMNPQTGQFDKTQLITFLQSLETADPAQQAAWAQQEKLFAQARSRVKYDNLIATTEYATTAEAKFEHKLANTIADASILFVPYYVIPDGDIQIQDSELSAYLSKNKEKFKVGNAANLEYVSFSILPSGEDSAAVISKITALTDELKAAENDSAFVSKNSELQQPFQTFAPGDQLPVALTTNVDVPAKGETYGPFITANSSYVTYKITDQYQGTPRMRASHILFGTEGMDDSGKAAVKTQAETVLAEIKASGNFEVAARQYGQDGTAQNGGDLGWFAKADFVEPFANATYAARSKGLLPNLVETEYGYHIIQVTELPATSYTKLAILELELVASDLTRNEAFRNADAFVAESGNRNEFTENATEKGFRIIQANNVDPTSRNLNNLTDARQVVIWAFSEAAVGEVSTVFELNDAYLVASLVSRKEEGEAKLEDVKDQVKQLVLNEKKAALIQEKLSAKATLEEMKGVFTDAAINEVPSLRLSDAVLPGIGFAPKAIGTIFGLQGSGQLTKPVQEDIGVLVGRLNTLTPAAEIGDYTVYQSQLTQGAFQRMTYQIMMALQELAKVKDYRYKYF